MRSPVAALRRAPRALILAVAGAALVGGGAAVFAAAQADSPSAVAHDDSVAVTSPTTHPRATTTTSSTTTTTLPPNPPPTPLALPPLPPGGLHYGARGNDVAAYELRLKQLRFDPGEVDGYFDTATLDAVEAAEKILGAPVRGVIDDGLRFGLSTFQWPAPMQPDGEPDRVEVSLDRQYMIVYHQRKILLLTTVSTGSGKVFCGGNDGCQYATTPPGRFTLNYFVHGWRKGSLGRMYQPFYFNGGIAVHGYPTVPTTPGSHGCVRIPMHIADYWHVLVHKGEPIYVVGTAAAPYGKAPPPVTVPPPTTTTTTTTTATTVPPTTFPPTTPPTSTSTTTTLVTPTTHKGILGL